MNMLYFISWLILMVLANINGFIREKYIKNKFSEHKANQISTIILIMIIVIYSFILQSIYPFTEIAETFYIGIWWFVLTLLFEFIAGHFLFGKSYKELLDNYKIYEGKLWIFVPIWTLTVNYLVYKAIK